MSINSLCNDDIRLLEAFISRKLGSCSILFKFESLLFIFGSNFASLVKDSLLLLKSSPESSRICYETRRTRTDAKYGPWGARNAYVGRHQHNF